MPHTERKGVQVIDASRSPAWRDCVLERDLNKVGCTISKDEASAQEADTVIFVAEFKLEGEKGVIAILDAYAQAKAGRKVIVLATAKNKKLRESLENFSFQARLEGIHLHVVFETSGLEHLLLSICDPEQEQILTL